jgi:hypothetical protein
VLELALLKPRWWFCYVDDTFVVWLHGPDKLKDFLHHLNNIHQSSQFTMQIKSEGHLPFLDLDIYRRPDGSMGHNVFLKPTRTNLYLKASLSSLIQQTSGTVYSGAYGQSYL